MKKAKFITLGCRVNQYDTQGMREILKAQGFESYGMDNQWDTPEVDVVVINTCTVTADADKDSRYWVRRARRVYPKAKIVVTGCGVEKNRKDYAGLPEVDLIVSNFDKDQIGNYLLQSCASRDEAIIDATQRQGVRYDALKISNSAGKTRAFVKIQDGCNHACSFCKVVLVRGKSRSRDLVEIRDEVTRLRDAGYQEIVFAGIQLGAYGMDNDNKKSRRLAQLLYESSRIKGIERLRLSSIEPTDINDDLIEALRDIPQCMPHLHIPLQSGDDMILKRMNRRYGQSFYRDLIDRLRGQIPEFELSLDVMAGFPGEEEKHFLNTLKLLQDVKPQRCHVFPYSKREGTRAAGYSDWNVEVKRDRVRRLRLAADLLGREVRSRYLGKSLQVLAEGAGEEQIEQGWIQGYTPNFIRVLFRGGMEDRGKLFSLKLISLGEEDAVWGEGNLV